MNFQETIINWYLNNGRNFTWRYAELDSWHWLALEILLKKTKAETVEKYFENFISKYHKPDIIYSTSDPELEADLNCFGLFRKRCEAFKHNAAIIVEYYNGSTDYFLLDCPKENMKQIGDYIYNAVLCFSFNVRKPIVDINIARIITRYFGKEMPNDLRKQWIWELAEKLLPKKNYIEYNFGMLDIGALFCKNNPKCKDCPLIKGCFSNCIFS